MPGDSGMKKIMLMMLLMAGVTEAAQDRKDLSSELPELGKMRILGEGKAYVDISERILNTIPAFQPCTNLSMFAINNASQDSLDFFEKYAVLREENKNGHVLENMIKAMRLDKLARNTVLISSLYCDRSLPLENREVLPLAFDPAWSVMLNTNKITRGTIEDHHISSDNKELLDCIFALQHQGDFIVQPFFDQSSRSTLQHDGEPVFLTPEELECMGQRVVELDSSEEENTAEKNNPLVSNKSDTSHSSMRAEIFSSVSHWWGQHRRKLALTGCMLFVICVIYRLNKLHSR
jgi:hypothetical protein